MLKEGEKVHVVQRRSFESDVRRHFIGEVQEANDVVARVFGYVFVFDKGKNSYIRLPESRTRILSLTDAALIINLLPDAARIEKARYTTNKDMRLVVTDGETFSLDINEFGVSH